MIKLEVSAFESHPAQIYSISQARTTIGRNPTNDIVVDSQNVSGAHAEIVRTDESGLRIRDLDSINGTFVNGEPVTDSPIEPGDKLRFGNIEGNLAESAEAQPIAFGSLAISQAKQAMEKLNQELPHGSGQTAEPDIGAPSEAAAAENPPPDEAAPDVRLEARLDEPATEESAGGEPADAGNELAAGAVEMESLRTWISELERDRTGLVRANETLRETLAEKTEAFTDLDGQLREKDAALADQQKEKAELRAKLDDKRRQAEQGSAEKMEQAAAETAALRAELAALKEAHGEVADACAELGAVQQEIESYGEQRARLQQELKNDLAQAEATRQAAIEENAEVRRALKDSRKELEILKQAVNEAEQLEDLRRETEEAAIRELEERRQAKADALAGLEARKEAVEERLEEVAVSTGEMKSKGDRLDVEVAKAEQVLRRIQGKIGRRKKLLGRLKTVGRREREVAKEIKKGKQFLEAAESHKAAQNLPKVQPWDVDRARADRDQALEEARKIQQEVDLMKAELMDRQRELKDIEAGILQKDSNNPFYSEDPDEAGRECGDPSRLAAQLP